MPAIDGETERAIQAEEDGLQNALMGPDLDWLTKHWADDAVYVHMSGGVHDRAGFIENLRSRSTIYKSRKTSDMRLRRYGETVIATGTSDILILVKGEPRELSTKFTRVYVRQNGRWVLASNQSGANTANAPKK